MNGESGGNEMIDVVTIDGPAGAGKSTVARTVARGLGFTFLDTGAMYRAVALGAVEAGIGVSDTNALTRYLAELDLVIVPNPEVMELRVNGRDVTRAIRRPEMGQYASDYSTLPAVREFCSRRQREFGGRGRVVCEGRDMGTVVFPDARWKFFLTASVAERARRRWAELRDGGEDPDRVEIKRAIRERDRQDSERALAPLKPAGDAVIIDTTELSLDEVVAQVIGRVRPRQS